MNYIKTEIWTRWFWKSQSSILAITPRALATKQIYIVLSYEVDLVITGFSAKGSQLMTCMRGSSICVDYKK